MNNRKTLIFDLDGTLLNSIDDIAICMNEVLKEFNLKVFEIPKYKYFVGYGVDILVENVLKAQNREDDKFLREKISKRFKEVYDNVLHKNTKPYDGIIELLETLQENSCNLAVLSNKPHNLTVSYVNNSFPNINFLEIHGQKSDVPKKPDPFMALEIAKKINVDPKDVYFIGDTKVDMQTAKSANMTAIGVLWGFRDEKELKDFGADHIVNNPLQIIKIIL